MTERTSGLPDHWDLETDVVVVGSGGAALTGALTAANEGAEVIVLEKAPKLGGTTARSGGGVWIGANRHTAEVGVEDSRDDVLTYLKAICGQPGHDDIIEAIVDRGIAMVGYLEDNDVLCFEPYPSVGGTLDYRPWAPGAKYGGRPLTAGNFEVGQLGDAANMIDAVHLMDVYVDKLDFYRKRLFQTGGDRPTSEDAADRGEGPWFGNGTALIAHLLKGCLDRGVNVHTSARVEELSVDQGVVVGVRASINDQSTWIHAKAGVLLACGGFEHNPMLRTEFLSRPLELTCGVETNEGDGHVMGMSVGAQLANLADAWWQMVTEVIDNDGAPRSVHIRAERCNPHSIIVNQHGERFMNEAINYYDATQAFGTKQDGSRNLPAWLLVDQQYRDKYPLLPTVQVNADAGEPHWLRSARSLSEMAATLGIDRAALARTVERFNGFARQGVDEDFGRGESTWDREWGDPEQQPNPSLGTLEKPPFYAVEMKPGAMGTKGGLKINPNAEVIAAATGEAIPGLYAAGNTSNGTVPHGYAGPGATIGPGMTFGYVAGLELARRQKEM